MTTCRVCAGREVREVGSDRNVLQYRGSHGPTAGQAEPDGAVLLLRVWRDGELRARLLGVDAPYRTVATASGIDGICDAVRAWLQRV